MLSCAAAVVLLHPAGEVLRGDRIENSMYAIRMLEDEQCNVLCRIEALSEAQARAFRLKIDDEYKVNM